MIKSSTTDKTESWAFDEPETLSTQGDGTGRDEHDFSACLHLCRDLLGNLRKPAPIGAQRPAADFDDDSLAVAKRCSGGVVGHE